MDPDEALRQLREALKELGRYDDTGVAPNDLDDAVSAFDALDKWLSGGGFPPHDWRPFK